MAQEYARRARSFGPVARTYDRHRPSYPDALYTDLLALVPGRRVLEAGAGSGLATTALARHGAEVVAVEPDPEMAAVLRERTAGAAVEVVVAPIEEYEPEPGGFDLVTAAQAWHWVDQERGPAVAARALHPQGVLALWWNRARDHDDEVWAAVHDVYARVAPEIGPDRRLSTQPEREAAFGPAPGFGPWTRVDYDWTARYDAASYAGLLATHSNHILLPDEQRARLLEGVRAAIDAHGGELAYRYRTLLVHAHPAPDG